MAIFQTANSHQTSSLIAEQLPDFVREDHPVFVTFLEKYYEFLANNTLMETPQGSGNTYYGADTALKLIPDINDIDTTDLDKFIESFRKQYAPTLPQQLSTNTNTRTLYKNLIDFYRSIGTEDSFKLLFRVLFDDEIEIYYPKQDMLIASGGEWKQQVRIRVQHVDNLNDIENKKIIGATSGAYGTVEKIQILPKPTDDYISGQIANTSLDYHGTFGGANSAGISNSEIYDSQRFVEDLTQTAFIYMTGQSGEFELFEEIYVDDPTVSVANTVVFPLTKRQLLFKNFSQRYANSVISITDQLHRGPANSTFPPWGSANISYANSGVWHTTGLGQGEIKLVSVYGSSTGQVLQIGNNSSTGTNTAYGDLRHFVYSRNIGVGGEDRLYRMMIRARDLGGNSASSVAEGNRFSAGIACLRHDQRKLSSDGYSDQWEDPIWLVSHKQAIDDEFFVYIAYFRGREVNRSITANTPYLSTNYGSGGRTDLTSGTRYYNSAPRAMNGEVRLPFNTTWFRPTFKVNEPGDGATYSQGITQIDFVSIEEIGTMQTQLGKNLGAYQSERSLLSTKGAHLHDGYYRQIYAYDIRSKQQMKDYATIVRETVHPAGLKMFGTKITESSARIIDSIEPQSDGTITQLTFNTRDDSWPSWSPDGNKIVFHTGRNDPAGNSEIYAMNSDGSNPIKLSSSYLISDNRYPSWSPDGTKITFTSNAAGNWDIYTMNSTDGSDLKNLTNNPSNSHWLSVYSPDGTKILFSRRPINSPAGTSWNSKLYTMNSDGSNVTKLTYEESVDDADAVWSPDGTQIAYRDYDPSAGPGKGYNIIIMNADGTNPKNITKYSSPDSDYMAVQPNWSPDGTRIAFATTKYPTIFNGVASAKNISIINIDGSGEIRLTSNVNTTDAVPSWSPDGTQILFHSGYPSDGVSDYEIYVVDIRNRVDTNLSDTFSPDQLGSLAGWWRADALGPENLEERKYVPQVAANGIYGTNTNRLPIGMSTFENLGDVNYTGEYGSTLPADAVVYTADAYVTLDVVPKESPIGGRRVLKTIDYHRNTNPRIWWSGDPKNHAAGIYVNRTMPDHVYPIVLEPNKKWLFSTYAMTSNLTVESSHNNTIRPYFYFANASGADTDAGAVYTEWSDMNVSSASTWTRVASVLDNTEKESTRAYFVVQFPPKTQRHSEFNETGWATQTWRNRGFGVDLVGKNKVPQALSVFTQGQHDYGIFPDRYELGTGEDGETAVTIASGNSMEWSPVYPIVAANTDTTLSIDTSGGANAKFGSTSLKWEIPTADGDTISDGVYQLLFSNTHSNSVGLTSGAHVSAFPNQATFNKYGISITPGKKWVYSFYVKHDQNLEQFVHYIPMYASNGSYVSQTSYAEVQTKSYNQDAVQGDWIRVWRTWDLSYGEDDEWRKTANSIILGVGAYRGTSTDRTAWYDGFQFEEDDPSRGLPDGVTTVASWVNDTTHPSDFELHDALAHADTLHLDGLMLEEYTPEIHGTSHPYTPSPYVLPGMSGANVLSWYDQSPNKHHVYANTHGGTFYSPQYVANAVGGKPAVRFSANTVKNTGNVYAFSSIGGTVNSLALELEDATNFKSPTSGLQSRSYGTEFADGAGTLASNSLPRTVSNTWTIMAVVKTNLGVNATSYDSTLNPTIFNSGYGGNRDSNVLIPNRARGTMSLGYDVIGSNGAVVTNLVNNRGEMTQANTSEITDFGGSHSSPSTQSSFRIVGVSVDASGIDYHYRLQYTGALGNADDRTDGWVHNFATITNTDDGHANLHVVATDPPETGSPMHQSLVGTFGQFSGRNYPFVRARIHANNVVSALSAWQGRMMWKSTDQPSAFWSEPYVDGDRAEYGYKHGFQGSYSAGPAAVYLIPRSIGPNGPIYDGEDYVDIIWDGRNAPLDDDGKSTWFDRTITALQLDFYQGGYGTDFIGHHYDIEEISISDVDPTIPVEHLNFHIDGRRFANSEINNSRADLSFAGFDGHAQNTYTTSIGKWKPVKGAVLPFPVYPQANGIMGVGATGNVVFLVNCSNTNIHPAYDDGPMGDIWTFNLGGIDFIAPHSATGNSTVNSSIIPTVGHESTGDYGIPVPSADLSIYTPYEGTNINSETALRGTGKDSYLMYSHMNAVARFGTSDSAVKQNPFGFHMHILPVEWDAANNTWLAIYNGTEWSPDGTGATAFVPDAANGDFIVARINRTDSGSGLYEGITDFESFIFAANSQNQSYGGGIGNSVVRAIAGSGFTNQTREVKYWPGRTYISDTYKNLITGTADWDGDIAEIVVFNEKLSNTNISKVEGYLAHKYSLQENLIHKDGITNDTEIYRWEFANTQDGWQFPSAGTISYEWEGGDVNNYIIIPGDGSGGTSNVRINLPTHIDGSAYDHFSIRYYVDDNGVAHSANVFQFGWKNDGSSVIHKLTAAGGAGGYTAEDTWYQNTYNLSGESEWNGKKITYLEYSFITSDGNDDYKIDWVTVSGNNHPHPYRYNAPIVLGANGWNASY